MATAGSVVIDLLMRTGSFETDTKRAEDRLKKFKKEAVETGKAVGTVFAAGAAVATAALVTWTDQLIDLGAELDRFAKLGDTTTQEFQRWAAGAASVGIQQDKLADQLKDFNEKTGEFLQTGGGPMKDFFEQIAPKVGLTADAFRDLSGPEGLQLYFDALEKANLSQKDMSFYLEAMASDTTALIPLLRDGGKGFDDWGDKAARAGAILSGETTEAIRGFRVQSAELDLVLQGMRHTLAEELLAPTERFMGLLTDSESQSSIKTLAGLVGDLADGLADLAEMAAKAGNSYMGFLKNQGFLPGEQLDSIDQLQTRAAKLRALLDPSNTAPWDIGSRIFRSMSADKIREELKRTEDQIKAFPFRDVTATVSFTPDRPARPSGGAGGGKGGAGKAKRDPYSLADSLIADREALAKLLEEEERARTQFEAMAAQLSGPVADANYRYARDLEELNELAAKGAIGSDELTRAQENLRKEHDANVAAIQERLEPGKQLLKDLQFELDLMKLTNAERATAIQLRGLDTEQIQKYGDAIAETNQKIMENAEQVDFMDGWRGEFQDFFSDVLTGTKSIGDAFEDMLSNISAMIAERIAQNWVDQLFGQMGSTNGGAAGGGEGGWLAGLASIFSSFGGSRAGGGDVMANRGYWVGEQGPEWFQPRTAGTVLPHEESMQRARGAERRSAPTVINVAVEGRVERQTRVQIGTEVDRSLQRSRRIS